ncbi:amino acid transporter (plasmid) [Streptomyces sp. NBC_01216]|uniref:nucleotidyltransferase domain-containing protein n=1 Tax=Streptomyces sp. NBC_01216 TaxID=2903778 RepID=UPI002E0DD093|nr:amino acid transporter [Streptomyces sp. NBC_01216]
MREGQPGRDWEPAGLAEVVTLFSKTPRPWWVAGGYAVELAVGRPFREHDDIDVLLLRQDQLEVQEVLAGWEWWAADPPGSLRRWLSGELLPVGVHDVWCRPGPGAPWRIQVMLDEADGETWVSRRDARVRRPVERLGARAADGTPFLAPEIQLFYKAKSPRPKDEQDFTEVLPHLAPEARAWLAEALSLVYGPHPWAAILHNRKGS